MHRRIVQKGINDLNNHDYMITNVDPYNQEYEVK